MKNAIPGTIRIPSIEVSLGSFHISKRTMLRIVERMNRLLTGRHAHLD